MVQVLPIGELSVVGTNKYLKSDNNIGYIYLNDVNYNNELKQKTKKYPLFPENTIVKNWTTNYQNENKN